MLTEHEHKALDITVELVEHMCHNVIGHEDTRNHDINELVNHIHAIQHMIMAQSAARVYPDKYRLLGDTL